MPIPQHFSYYHSNSTFVIPDYSQGHKTLWVAPPQNRGAPFSSLGSSISPSTGKNPRGGGKYENISVLVSQSSETHQRNIFRSH